ncbi:hypothetical protein SPRG_19744, partial [Saprolegnia parasitica CBS 223.65]
VERCWALSHLGHNNAAGRSSLICWSHGLALPLLQPRPKRCLAPSQPLRLSDWHPGHAWNPRRGLPLTTIPHSAFCLTSAIGCI